MRAAGVNAAAKLLPSQALAELFAQHEALRSIMDRCEELADELDAGRGDVGTLTREIVHLRVAFEAHNKFEERLLKPVDSAGNVRIDRMYIDHVGEHRAVHMQLGDGTTDALRSAIDNLRTHLETEERYLSARVTSQVRRDRGSASERERD
jgi:hypothetical protein